MRIPKHKDDACAVGCILLTPEDLRQRVFSTTIQGYYRGGFYFVSTIDRNGRMEGRNHVGAHNRGNCFVDEKEGTLTVEWDNGWEATTTLGYLQGDTIHFYDVDTGEWRNSFLRIQRGLHPLVIEN